MTTDGLPFDQLIIPTIIRRKSFDVDLGGGGQDMGREGDVPDMIKVASYIQMQYI
jgi:hypothetical protein